jgi:hypothetical protein
MPLPAQDLLAPAPLRGIGQVDDTKGQSIKQQVVFPGNVTLLLLESQRSPFSHIPFPHIPALCAFVTLSTSKFACKNIQNTTFSFQS